MSGQTGSALNGAGGIGGLLARTDNSQLIYGNPLAHAFYHADGNGNVTMLINSYQAIVAKYLYDPFGNTLSLSGSLASANVYRFSSKEWNDNAEIYYYLYRYYDPNLQRWPNRDPLGEEGGINLYAYAGNNPINFYDPYGLYSWGEWGQIIGAGAGGWSDAANSLGQSLGGSLAAGYDAGTGNFGLAGGDLNYGASGDDLSQNAYNGIAGFVGLPWTVHDQLATFTARGK